MKKLLLVLFLFVFTLGAVYAQTVQVKGLVIMPFSGGVGWLIFSLVLFRNSTPLDVANNKVSFP